MKISLNSSINVAGLVDALKASPTRAANLKHKIYYFLSLITDTNDNYRLNNNNGGYHNLCSCELKKVLGNKDFYIIRELLLNPDDPIIEVDNSWHNPNGTNSSGYCQGYRITHKYNTGEVTFKTIPNKLSKVITKYAAKEGSPAVSAPDYTFLINQFESNTLSFDPLVYEYIRNFGQQLFQKVRDNNEFQIMVIYNLIGRWLYYIEQISSGNPWRKVSNTNHRLNSSVTNLPRILRPFLLCNGKQLQCVDISSSQPYILSSVMQSKFYHETRQGYNIKTIYPELYNEMVSNGSIDSSITYSSTIGIQYHTSNTCYTNNTYSNNISNYSSFMWCNFSNHTDIDSLYRYTQSPFYLDFYTYVLDKYYTYTNKPRIATQKDDREKLKNTMMYVLFDDNLNHRNHNDNIEKFKVVFPGVDLWINEVHKKIGKQRFSYLLQRTESYLLLNVICREFHLTHPNAPLFTIHDGVFTTQEYVRNLYGYVLRRLHELTGIIAGCKIKASKIDPNPQIEDIENEWSKIKSINSKKRYYKNRNGVFYSNIKRSSEFLGNFSGNFLDGIVGVL